MEFKDQIIEYLNVVIDCNINLLDYAYKNSIPVYVNGNLNKGWKGNVVEHILNINQNSKKGSDYEGLEIKTVPIVKNGNYIQVKETTCLSVIDMKSLITQTFEDSDLLKKIQKTLFVTIDVSDIKNPHIDSTIYVDFSLHNEIYNSMKSDYNNIVEHILDNISSDNSMDKHFTGKLGTVIQPRPKTGKKGGYVWAFYMKKHILEKFLNNPNKLKKLKI